MSRPSGLSGRRHSTDVSARRSVASLPPPLFLPCCATYTVRCVRTSLQVVIVFLHCALELLSCHVLSFTKLPHVDTDWFTHYTTAHRAPVIYLCYVPRLILRCFAGLSVSSVSRTAGAMSRADFVMPPCAASIGLRCCEPAYRRRRFEMGYQGAKKPTEGMRPSPFLRATKRSALGKLPWNGAQPTRCR